MPLGWDNKSSTSITPMNNVRYASGSGPRNINHGSGEQLNSTIHGGTSNVLYSAGVQNIYGGRCLESYDLDLEFRRQLLVTDPTIDRINLIDCKGETVAGTCDWIFQARDYKKWLNDDTQRLLWVWGGPGKGKTMLAIFLSQELGIGTTTIFFFCSADDEKRNTAIAVIRGLLWQLTEEFPSLTTTLRERLPSNVKAALSSRETLWVSFIHLVGVLNCERLYCVIDGLDECEEDSRRWLAKKLVSLNHTNSASKLKAVVVSRKLLELRNVLQLKLDHDHIEDVDSAVRTFVQARSEELGDKLEFSDVLCRQIQSNLFNHAQGSFLWVGFAMVELLKQNTAHGVLSVLREMPIGLHPLYERMLRSIEASQRQMCTRILRCVALAHQPLTLKQLAFVADCRPPTSALNAEEAVRDLVNGCGPLLQISLQEVGLVTLVHQSVKDYMNRAVFPDGTRFAPEVTHLRFARRSIDALVQYNASRSPLLYYAGQFWPHHTQLAGTHAKALLSRFASFFDEHSVPRTVWWRSRGGWQSLPQLHMACRLGIKVWVDDILERSIDRGRLICLVDRDGFGYTPLHHAAEKGFDQIVGVVLNYSTSTTSETFVNVTSIAGDTALHLGVVCNNESTVRVLLQHNADVDARDFDGLTPLQRAILKGHEVILELLLEYSANVNAKDTVNRTALHLATDSVAARIRTLQLVADDIPQEGTWGGNSRNVAAPEDSETTVRRLLHHKADVNARDIMGRTALHLAVSTGTAKLLLENGSDVNARNDWNETALHLAVRSKASTMARLLLAHGANVNARDHRDNTALHDAVHCGAAAEVKLLLEHGADIDAKNDKQETVLYDAMHFRDPALVKLLLEHGVQVNSRNHRNETVLFKAVDTGDSETVNLLIEHGADVNAKDKFEETVLHRTARRGDQAGVNLLLEHNVGIDASNLEAKTALMEALDSHEIWMEYQSYQKDGDLVSNAQMVIRILVEHGARFDAESEEGGRILQIVNAADQ